MLIMSVAPGSDMETLRDRAHRIDRAMHESMREAAPQQGAPGAMGPEQCMLFDLGRRQLRQPIAQQLQGCELGGERRAELVRDVRENSIAEAMGRFRLRLVTDDLEL